MRLPLGLLLLALPFTSPAAEDWQSALSRMPLPANVTVLGRTNCVGVMLNALQSNSVVKALIFMPGATDEFYMFHRARAQLTNASPTLLDAVTALTNQSLVRATFRPPFLLLHSDSDPLEPLADIQHPATAAKLRQKRFVPHVVYNDKDWDFLFPILTRACGVFLNPPRYSTKSWHFYRHSFAAWNLDGWEALQAVSLAGKTKFRVESREVIFEGDRRVLAPTEVKGYVPN
jgi:hypothetical protein